MKIFFKSLNLKNNFIGIQGMKEICNMLKSNDALVSFDLRFFLKIN